MDDARDPSDDELEELESAATDVRGRLAATRQPVVVEFAGSPKAGKSTTIDVITHFFKRMGFKVRAPSEGASKRTPYHLKRHLVAFNSWTLNYAISELLDAYYNVDTPDLVILDRGPFDSLAWLGLLNARDELDDVSLAKMTDFALLPLWTKLVSRIYLFNCDPEVSLARESNAKLTRRTGTAMNLDMLTSLRGQYDEVAAELDEYPVVPLDTTSTTSPLGTSFLIAKDVLELFDSADDEPIVASTNG